MADHRKAKIRYPTVQRNEYRMLSATVVLIAEDGRQVAHTLPKGAVITVDGEDSGDPRLITVMWDGLQAVMFTQDLRSRCERINHSIRRMDEDPE
jgi:hypothetical protein